MEHTELESSTVQSVGYDPTQRVLEIVFRAGRAYRYFDVPEQVFRWLLRVGSPGTYVNRHIKDRYRYEEIVDEASDKAREEEVDLTDALARSVWLTRDT